MDILTYIYTGAALSHKLPMEVSSNHSTIKINAEFLRLSAVNSLKYSTCVCEVKGEKHICT